MTVKGRVSEGFTLVLAEKPRISENNVINLVSGTFTVQPVPLFLRLLSLSKMSGTDRSFSSNKLQLMTCHDKTLFDWFLCNSFNGKIRFYTYCPLEVCSRRVTKVEAPGHVQLFAKRAYLNSSSHTTCSANFTWSLFSGRKICTYWGTFGAKSFTAHDLLPIIEISIRHSSLFSVNGKSHCILHDMLSTYSLCV